MNSSVEEIFELQKLTSQKFRFESSAERKLRLIKFKITILKYYSELLVAFQEDFGKSETEAALTEIAPVIGELDYAIKKLNKWMKPIKVCNPFFLFGTTSFHTFEPKGRTLVVSPWNYPLNLAFSPLINSIAAGNTVILRPSEKVPKINIVVKKIIADAFHESEVAVVTGGRDVADKLLSMPFDHIVFTGSTPVGKKVMKLASDNLTPVTLELGGKSPAIITRSANLKKAAEKIAWGKFLNAGQTCVAPDFALVPEESLETFIKEVSNNLDHFTKNPGDLCNIIGGPQKLKKLIIESQNAGVKISYQSKITDDKKLPPTILTNVNFDSPIMRDEIFGPILPIITYKNLDEALAILKTKPRPLALYVFTEDELDEEKILKEIPSGGTTINDVIIHVGNHHLPFGGNGYSGMGKYHGHFGFLEFSHQRAVTKRNFDMGTTYFYPPYTKKMLNIIKRVFKLKNANDN